MTIKINYSSDIGGAKSGAKSQDQNLFKIANRKKRNEIFDNYEGDLVRNAKNKKKNTPFRDRKQLENFENQKQTECNDVFETKTYSIDGQEKPFNEMNYEERSKFLKNDYDNLDELDRKCLKFDKNNVDPISENAKIYCDELAMENYQDYINDNPNLCPDKNKKFTYMKLCDDIAKKFIVDDKNQNNVNVNLNVDDRQGLKKYLSEAERGKNISKKQTYTESVAFEYLPGQKDETRKRIVFEIVDLISKEFPDERYDVHVELLDN